MYFFAGSLIFLALAIAAVAMRAKLAADHQNDWDKAEGKIVSSSVRMSSGYFDPAVTYEYTYLGRKYRGDRVRSLYVSVNWRSPAEKTVARYREGQVVTVFIKPDDPGYAVLEPGGDTKFLPLVTTVAVAIGLIGTWMLVRT